MPTWIKAIVGTWIKTKTNVHSTSDTVKAHSDELRLTLASVADHCGAKSYKISYLCEKQRD